MRVILATSNEGKVREATAILARSEIEIETLPIWLGDVETGTSYIENARLKAASVMRVVGRPVLAEDAGLEVDALGGLPGIHSARFAGPDASATANNDKLLRLLKDVPADRRTARFRAVAVLLLPSGREIVGDGTFEGSIADRPRGEAGFGYDPLFLADGEGRTAAELPEEEKNRVSHRAHALRAILASLG